MPTTKITTKHQVTIPHDVFKMLDLSVGDILETFSEGGKIVMVPKRLTDRTPAVKLSSQEQKILGRAQDKIELINNDALNSRGLTKAEIKVAIKADLVDPDQVWWWTEKSQKGHRESLKETETGGLESFDSIEGLKARLTG